MALRDELIENYISRAPVESTVSFRWNAEVGRVVDQLAPESAKAPRQSHLYQLVKALGGKQGEGAEAEKAKSWWAAQGLSMTGGIDPAVYHVAQQLARGRSVEELRQAFPRQRDAPDDEGERRGAPKPKGGAAPAIAPPAKPKPPQRPL